jgi:hypothetical protein
MPVVKASTGWRAAEYSGVWHRFLRTLRVRHPAIGACTAAAVLSAGVAAAASDAWRYGESLSVGGSSTLPWVAYVGPGDHGFDLTAECRGSGPSVYVTVNNPGADLRALRFNMPIAVAVRVERTPEGKPAPADEVRITATLSEGYLAHTNRVRVGMGLHEGAAVVGLLGRDPGSNSARALVRIGDTSAAFELAGARAAFAQLKRSCDAQRR